MSIFLGNLKKYYKDQKPINILTYNYQFEDPEFPPQDDRMIYSSDEEKNKLFFNNVIQRYNLDPNQKLIIEYRSVKEYFENIFDEKINCTKFIQGSIGNCYFLNVVSLLSNYGQLLTQIFRYDKMNIQGYYEICLFIDGQWQIVIIDDYIPFLVLYDEEGNKNFCFISCSPAKDCNCCYFLLLEKAFAKVKGSYVDMEGGFSGHVFQMLTGFSYITINHGLKSKEDLFDLINKKIYESDYLFCCNSKEDLVGGVHSFSILNTERFKIGIGEGSINMLQLRNPWGTNEVINNSIRILMNEENKKKLSEQITKFLIDEENGILWVDDFNFKTNFEITQCCYSMFGSNVYSFRFNNVEKDRDHNIFVNSSGKLLFKLEIEEDSKIILSHFFNYEGPNLNFECSDCNSNENKNFSLKMEFALKKGNYIIIATFDNVNTNKDYIYLIINLFCVNKVKFEFICSRPKNEANIIYKNILTNIRKFEDLKRTKMIYKHCEELRDKFLFHQTLIKFFKEKLGCEFTLSGLGFYLDTYSSDKVECMIRIDKNKRSKFDKIIVSQYIQPNKKPAKELYVGTEHVKGEIVGKGEVWKIKEVPKDLKFDEQLDAKCIFRGEIVQNKKKENNKEVINDPKASIFKEDNTSEKMEQEKIKDKKIASIEIIEENSEEGIIRIKSKLVINKKIENKIKSLFHDHYLYLCNTVRFLSGAYKCDKCQESFGKNVPSYYCTICDYDLCEECAKITEKPKQSEEQDESSKKELFWQFKSNKHNDHPLTYLSMKKFTEKINCFACENPINPEDFFYCCSNCQFYLCENCKIKEKPGNPFQLSLYWHEHPLSICYPLINKSLDIFTCNHCSKVIIFMFHFYCTKCDYHLCFDCYKKYSNNFSNIDIRTEKNDIEPNKDKDKFDFQFTLIEHKHPLTVCIFNSLSDNDKYARCHICRERLRNSEICYLCSLCDFKYCIKCITKLVTK